MRRSSAYICGRILLTRHLDFSGKSRLLSRSTRQARSNKSTTRNSARCSPNTISGSRTTRSVHCGGTEQTVPSSTCSNSRFPERLYRSPTQPADGPPSGWNGCVIRTSCVETAERLAFKGELQAAGTWPIRVAVTGRRDARDLGGAAGLYAGRHRLAKPAADLASGQCRIRFGFCRSQRVGFVIHSRSWTPILPRCRTTSPR